MVENNQSPTNLEQEEPNVYSKRRFTPSEDKIIISLAKPNCTNDWNSIAKSVEKRSPRQCRDRWNNYLNPNLNKDEWVPEEDELLMKIFNEKGPQWKSFSLLFKGRSINNVRNRCFKLLRKTHRNRSITQIYDQAKSLSSCTKKGKQSKKIKKNIDNCESPDSDNIDDDPGMKSKMNSKNEKIIQVDQKNRLDVDYFIFDNDNDDLTQKYKKMLPNHINDSMESKTDNETNLQKYSIDTSEIDKVMDKFEKMLEPINLFSLPNYYGSDMEPTYAICLINVFN